MNLSLWFSQRMSSVVILSFLILISTCATSVEQNLGTENLGFGSSPSHSKFDIQSMLPTIEDLDIQQIMTTSLQACSTLQQNIPDHMVVPLAAFFLIVSTLYLFLHKFWHISFKLHPHAYDSENSEVPIDKFTEINITDSGDVKLDSNSLEFTNISPTSVTVINPYEHLDSNHEESCEERIGNTSSQTNLQYQAALGILTPSKSRSSNNSSSEPTSSSPLSIESHPSKRVLRSHSKQH